MTSRFLPVPFPCSTPYYTASQAAAVSVSDAPSTPALSASGALVLPAPAASASGSESRTAAAPSLPLRTPRPTTRPGWVPPSEYLKKKRAKASKKRLDRRNARAAEVHISGTALVQASSDRPGFRVSVAGWSGSRNPGPLADLVTDITALSALEQQGNLIPYRCVFNYLQLFHDAQVDSYFCSALRSPLSQSLSQPITTSSV